LTPAIKRGAVAYFVGLLLGMAIALVAAFALPTQTKAQPAKEPSKSDLTAAEKVDPKKLYGKQGGEKVAPADDRAPNRVMRARLEDTFLKLSQPRFGQNECKQRTLVVDFEVVSRGQFDGGTLVVHGEDGKRAEKLLKTIAGRDHGTIEFVTRRQPPDGFVAGALEVPDNNFELYVLRGDQRYDPPYKCMVSNSVVVGTIKATTLPREWTLEEIDRYHIKPPPVYKNPNTLPNTGVDVPPLPDVPGLSRSRYVDPKGRLIGLDYRLGEWDKQKTIWGVTPVYKVDQPQSHTARSIAREGYVVSGAEINAGKYLNGVRLLFRRVKKDGTLDLKDFYSGEWIGVAPTQGEATKVVDDGRPVIGIDVLSGAIVDRFALVVEPKEKK
jgi:hypothetical protein